MPGEGADQERRGSWLGLNVAAATRVGGGRTPEMGELLHGLATLWTATYVAVAAPELRG